MKAFFEIFRRVKSEETFQELLDITFTEKEQAMMVERWRILAELDKGQSQREVAKAVNCSVVTVTRGAKVYRDKTDFIKKWLKYFNKAI